MFQAYLAVMLFFFISNKYLDNIGILFVSYLGFTLAMILYTKAIVDKTLELKKSGDLDENLFK